MESQHCCVICKEFVGGKLQGVQLREKGSITINNVSSKRGDDILSNPGDFVHVTCRKAYTHPTCISHALRTVGSVEDNQEPSTSLRSQSKFNFATHCLFCGQIAKLSQKKRGNDIYQVRTGDFQTAVIQACKDRGDEWASTVRGRIESVNDLHAADAMYHQACNVNFRTKKCVPIAFSPDSKKQKTNKGRPNTSHKYFVETVEYLKQNDCEQLTVTDLVEKMREMCGEQAYTNVYMKKKLEDHFGDDILITETPGMPSIITLRASVQTILQEFYRSPKENPDDEKLAIINTAAKLIKAEIKSIPESKDFFPAASDMSSLEHNLNYIPESLKEFLRRMFSEKDSNLKISSIGQSIMKATRPRILQPPLQVGLGIQLHHHFASKYLIDLCHSLGFCCPYAEVQKFEGSAAASLGSAIQGVLPDSCIQFVADNVDHNIRTIDGNNTFHGMGIIATVTPGRFTSQPIPCINVAPDNIKLLGEIEVKTYRQPTNSLSAMSFPELEYLQMLDTNAKIDVIVKTIWPLRAPMPVWAGVMQLIQQGNHPGKTSLTLLPMIDMPPSDLSCIYSTLLFTSKLARENDRIPIITFDQPLYWKAYTILNNESSGSDLTSTVLRLGGFHLEMSFLGAIGKIMEGSGLQYILETVYSPNAVTHMLSGKAVSRAIRGHMLVDNAVHAILTSRLFPNINDTTIPDPDKQPEGVILKEATDLYDGLLSGEVSTSSFLSHEVTQTIIDKLANETETLKSKRTAKLWLQYADMVQLLKSYLRAERTGDWSLHLSCVQEMLPYFAASGHNLYAKSAYTYLAAMQQLSTSHPEVERFFRNGYHVLRRSDRYWAGLSSDLVIEQELMRSVKTTGGLTRGRGLGEVQRAQWLLSMPACADVNNAMQSLTGVGYHTSDQHKENSTSRQQRDLKDTNTIMGFLGERDPFSEDSALRNIETGEIADPSVNQDNAKEIGHIIIRGMKGQNILQYSFKRSKQVQTMGTKSTIKVDGERIEVDPQLLFQRIMTASNRIDDDPAELFQYELCGFPSSLFDSSGYPREAQKSSLADAIWSLGGCNAETVPQDIISVIDGGSLLQRLPWNIGASFSTTCHMYLDYIRRKYALPTVVFDGYLNGPSIKDVTHIRRSKGKISRRIEFSGSTPCRTKKEIFLSNSLNKQDFINLLSETLQQNGCPTLHAKGDADLLIVQTAISASKMQNVEVIGEDTDLLVLLCFHAKPDLANIFFRSECHRTPGKAVKIWDIKATQKKLGEEMCTLLPALHAMTGCDSTSRLFGIGKGPAFQKLQQRQNLREKAALFIAPFGDNSTSSLLQAGESMIVALYGGLEHENLDVLRYRKFVTKARTGTTCVHINTLPPTSNAAQFHIKRVYLQCQWWLGEEMLQPTDWGWSCKNNTLFPITCNMPPAPDHLLKIVRCSCKVNCESKRCTCKRYGLECSSVCKECKGISCSNAESVTISDLMDETFD